MTTLIAEDIKYFSQKDEDAFFRWMKDIDCISSVRGIGRQLLIELDDSKLSDGNLREIIALLHRYGIEKKQLQSLLTTANAPWFRDPIKYWHNDVFGHD